MADRDDNHVIAPWKHQFGKLGHLTKYWNYLYVVNGYITTLISNAITATTGTITTLTSNAITATTGTITTLTSTTATIGTLNVTTVNTPTAPPIHRAKFIWKDADEIYINPGCYYHLGTSEQNIYWNSQLTYQFQNLANSDWSYLYLDDSAIVTLGSKLITASELIDSTTEPTWSDTKHGWYNGEDRCIFAVLTDGSGNILEFFHDGDMVVFEDDIQDFGWTEADTFVDVTLSIPKFTQKAMVTFAVIYVDANTTLRWRVDGASGSGYHYVCEIANGEDQDYNASNVITSTSQIIEISFGIDTGNQASVRTNGWYFPDTV